MYWNVKHVIHYDWIWNGRHFVRQYAFSNYIFYNQNISDTRSRPKGPWTTWALLVNTRKYIEIQWNIQNTEDPEACDPGSKSDVIGWGPPVIYCIIHCMRNKNKWNAVIPILSNMKNKMIILFSSYICFGSRSRNKHFVCFAKAVNAAMHYGIQKWNHRGSTNNFARPSQEAGSVRHQLF